MLSRRILLILALFTLLAGALLLIYVSSSRNAGHGEIVLPLDDVYIHFQYAKQIALGQPYIYNPGDPPTSGATSFLYPYLLAIGYLIGFQGLNLGLWAMLIGMIALVASLYFVYALLRQLNAPDWLAISTALIFGLTGAVNWHFYSGMETGLVICFVLATLYTFAARYDRAFVLSATLLALIRPEASVMSLIAVGLWLVDDIMRTRHAVSLRNLRAYVTASIHWLLFIPLLAVFVQPTVNLLVTGTPVATGNSVKSIFGLVPFYWDVVLGRIVDNFVNMWGQFLTGISPREGMYLPYFVGPLGMAALLWSLWKGQQRRVSLLVILWLLAGTAAISTLDTAFWHFKRYQMPLMALFFPLAGWAATEIQRKGAKAQRRKTGWTDYGLGTILVIATLIAISTTTAFVDHFRLNVSYVSAQPLQMARWLQANTPEDALVAVHDVGMMRYIGERHTLDMVGLTTEGAAAYWRNGPGSVAEFLIQERPDYIASYGEGHGLGLGVIAKTRIYGDALVEFPVDLDPNFNVALAAESQGIYQPEWEAIQTSTALAPFGGPTINVANLDSEAEFEYAWTEHERLVGFPTDLIEVLQPMCSQEPCVTVLAGRRINGAESFSLHVEPEPGKALLLATLLHAANPGTLDLYVNDQHVDRNWIPNLPGQYAVVPWFVPLSHITGTELRLRIETNGFYMPLQHLAWQMPAPRPMNSSEIKASYQNGSFSLTGVGHQINDSQLELHFQWMTDGSAEGDYRFFAHLYDNIAGMPIAQTDYYVNDDKPPGNWIPGSFVDSAMIDISDVPPGTYTLAIGFYDPYTGERLMPESEVYEVSLDGRLFLGEVEIPAEE